MERGHFSSDSEESTAIDRSLDVTAKKDFWLGLGVIWVRRCGVVGIITMTQFPTSRLLLPLCFSSTISREYTYLSISTITIAA